MYDEKCLSNTKKAWLDIEETLLDEPSHEEAIDCLKRVRHLLTRCIHDEQHAHHLPQASTSTPATVKDA
jgi:hypothetical protein